MRPDIFTLFAPLLLLLSTAFAARATPESDFEELTRGVTRIPLKGTSGAVSAQGRLAVPIVLTPKSQTLVAAGHSGDRTDGGRILALAHTSLLSSPDNPAWTLNAITWAARKNNPAILLVGVNPKDCSVPGATFLPLPKTWDAKALTKADVVIVSIHDTTFLKASEALTQFAKIGGGVIVLATPWAASKPSLEAAKTLLEPAGLAFLTEGQSDSTFPIQKSIAPFGNALKAAEALQDDSKTKKLSTAQRTECTAAIEACIASKSVLEPLKQILNTLHFSRGWVEIRQDQLLRRKSNPVDAMLARFQHLILENLPPNKTPAHPCASDFPGPVGEGPTIQRKIQFSANTPPNRLINHGELSRISTGLYAKPGTPITIQIPDTAANHGLRVEIGIHTDSTWHLPTWQRFPSISRDIPLNKSTTEAANAFGGLISILIPENSKLGPIEALVSGGVQAPVFTLGKTSDTDWNARVKFAPGAWGYIETPKWTGYLPAQILRSIEHPEAVATYWQKVVDTADTYLGYAAWRKRAESMITDRDISVGYGHAGYPVIMAYAAEKSENARALVERGPTLGDWGFLHELGHTFQDSFDGNYTIATHAEVDVNLVPGLIIHKLHNRTAWDNDSHSTFDAKTRLSDWDKWNALPENQQTWEQACKMKVAYDFYFTLAECHGWEVYQKAFTRWMNWLQKPGSDPDLDSINAKSSNAKRDRFALLFCQASGKNLLPFFNRYGLGRTGAPISDSILQKVRSLPVWSGNQPIASLEGPKTLTPPRNAPAESVLGVFKAQDPDPGTLFTYSIESGNSDDAFSIGRRDGQLRLKNPSWKGKTLLRIRVQDNCIPLSVMETTCEIMRP